MVHIYATNVENLPDPKENQEILEQFPKDRCKKILKYVNEKDRKLSLGAGLLLNDVLSEHGKQMSEIYTKENGKPYVKGLHFNLSHSNDIAICVVGNKNVGCDIEKIKKAPLSVAKRYFSEKEIAVLDNLSESEKDRGFFRLWTIKESYIKMTGEGLLRPLNSFEVSLESPVTIKCNSKIIPCLIEEIVIQDYLIAVCSEQEEISKKIIWITY